MVVEGGGGVASVRPLIGWLVFLVGFTGCLVGWLVGLLLSWSTGPLSSHAHLASTQIPGPRPGCAEVGRSGWLFGWLVGWFTPRLVGWLVTLLVGRVLRDVNYRCFFFF